VSLENNFEKLLNDLFPLPRSLTGNGNRQTLDIIKKIIPLKIVEYPSGQKVFDWTIPKEWNVKDAWIKDSSGKKIIDYSESNIHLVGYSAPITGKFRFKDIKDKIYYLEDQPEAIPYRTTYYKEDWGFCVTKKQYDLLSKDSGDLELLIDSEFKKDGSMTIGEILIKGKSSKEILVSTYICHPSLANDNLSGIVLTTYLAKLLLSKTDLNYSWRFIFVPETIGAIAYCANNKDIMEKIDTALVVTTVGGPGKFGYKQSFNGSHYINELIEKTFENMDIKYETYPFDIHGSDERQYSSIGFRINTASVTKDKYYEYKYYHNSLDNLDFVKASYLEESYNVYCNLINEIDNTTIFKTNNPNCEVMLSKHLIYPELGGTISPNKFTFSKLDIRLWLLFYLDGKKNLVEISKIMDIEFNIIYEECLFLEKNKIISRIA
tara:strand:+ start:201 stop:1502 length:1302 start_codon:yes stop_codon:yes gene_type:complete